MIPNNGLRQKFLSFYVLRAHEVVVKAHFESNVEAEDRSVCISCLHLLRYCIADLTLPSADDC